MNIWLVIVIGVAGSVLGRYILLLYAPILAKMYLKESKNNDIQILREKMRENVWKGQMIILAYSLLPLPTTPLFLGAGISKIKAKYIIPAFIIGKFTSDTIALFAGAYAVENTQTIIDNTFSWKSALSLVFGLILIFCLFVIDWRTLIHSKKLILNFKIWK
ncbi:hypothetical protein [Algoriphagus sp.]|uniref:hypothetical protein n=1 Tax=Algoriphagus sp. TaxID=1872435 RepID=UPI0025D42549|nr:hypothetical protein [Algoriphagus sp.]